MQIISRRANESLFIGEETQVTVREINTIEKWVQLEIRSSDGDCRLVKLFSPPLASRADVGEQLPTAARNAAQTYSVQG